MSVKAETFGATVKTELQNHNSESLRLLLRDIKLRIKHKRVPYNRYSFQYFLGGAAIFYFLMLFFSGILLSLYYVPGKDTAYEFIEMINYDFPMGWLIRSIHIWSSRFMVLTVLLHMIIVFFRRSYLPPRQITWISGFFLFLIVTLLSFSGFLLPWNSSSFVAAKIFSELMSKIPVIGNLIILCFQMDKASLLSGDLLRRFYSAHTVILPAIFTFVFALHIILIQLTGISQPVVDSKEKDSKGIKSIAFYPDFLGLSLIVWIVLLNLLFLVAAIFPAELGYQAHVFETTPDSVKPEWHFLFLYQTLKMLDGGFLLLSAEAFLIVGVSVFIGGGFLVPLIDCNDGIRKSIKSKVLFWGGLVFILYFLVMTLFGLLDT